MSLPKPYSSRISRLRAAMKKAGFQALLVFRPENRRYLSGFEAVDTQLDESSGCLFISLKNQFLLTDFRYRLQAEKEAVGYEVVTYKTGPAPDTARLCKRFKVSRAGFEEDFLTVKTHRALSESMAPAQLEASSGLVKDLRTIKDDNEIKIITKSLRITEKALAQTADFLKPGKTEVEVARFFEEAIKNLGAEDTAFQTIVASGPNAALPHAVPGNRKIRAGEPITIDCGSLYKGYKSDMTRTFFLGEPKPLMKKIYTLVRQAQIEAITQIQPGMKTDEADAIARSVITKGGYGDYFGHGLGHGVGLATHESPYLSRKQSIDLQPGMVVTVEPGIYLDNKGGVRLEEMVVITERGARVLNNDKQFYDWT